MKTWKLLKVLVGARGFEPPTSCSQSRRATELRYAPICFSKVCIVPYCPPIGKCHYGVSAPHQHPLCPSSLTMFSA